MDSAVALMALMASVVELMDLEVDQPMLLAFRTLPELEFSVLD